MTQALVGILEAELDWPKPPGSSVGQSIRDLAESLVFKLVLLLYTHVRIVVMRQSTGRRPERLIRTSVAFVI